MIHHNNRSKLRLTKIRAPIPLFRYDEKESQIQSLRISPILPRSGRILKPLLKPNNSLVESLIGRKLHLLNAQISAQRKAMLDTSIEIDLVRQMQIGQNLLGFESFFTREDGINLCINDGLLVTRFWGRLGVT